MALSLMTCVTITFDALANIKLMDRKTESTLKSMDRGKFTLITSYKVDNIESTSKLNDLVRNVRIEAFDNKSKTCLKQIRQQYDRG